MQFKVLSTLPTWGNKGLEADMKDRGTLVSISDQHKMGDAVFGVYRTHEEFVQAALQAKHPIDFACSFS